MTWRGGFYGLSVRRAKTGMGVQFESSLCDVIVV